MTNPNCFSNDRRVRNQKVRRSKQKPFKSYFYCYTPKGLTVQVQSDKITFLKDSLSAILKSNPIDAIPNTLLEQSLNKKEYLKMDKVNYNLYLDKFKSELSEYNGLRVSFSISVLKMPLIDKKNSLKNYLDIKFEHTIYQALLYKFKSKEATSLELLLLANLQMHSWVENASMSIGLLFLQEALQMLEKEELHQNIILGAIAFELYQYYFYFVGFSPLNKQICLKLLFFSYQLEFKSTFKEMLDLLDLFSDILQRKEISMIKNKCKQELYKIEEVQLDQESEYIKKSIVLEST